MSEYYVVQDYNHGTHSARVMNMDEIKSLLNLLEEKQHLAQDLTEISITYYREKAEICRNKFEISSGHTTTPCVLEKGHKGDCQGTILGSRCFWPSEYETEEEMHYAEINNNQQYR